MSSLVSIPWGSRKPIPSFSLSYIYIYVYIYIYIWYTCSTRVSFSIHIVLSLINTSPYSSLYHQILNATVFDSGTRSKAAMQFCLAPQCLCKVIGVCRIGAKCEINNSSFGCLGCEMRTEKNKSGSDPGAKCEMSAKNPDEPSVRNCEMRNVWLSRRVGALICLHLRRRLLRITLPCNLQYLVIWLS